MTAGPSKLANGASVAKVAKSVEYVHTIMAILVGVVAGTLGLTGLYGFALFLVAHAVVSGVLNHCQFSFCVVRCVRALPPAL